jgi:hypothetical protein
VTPQWPLPGFSALDLLELRLYSSSFQPLEKLIGVVWLAAKKSGNQVGPAV